MLFLISKGYTYTYVCGQSCSIRLMIILYQVYKARRVTMMKMMDGGFEEKAEARKAQKLKVLAEKDVPKKGKKRRRQKSVKASQE